MSLQLPAASDNLILNNVTVPSGYVNYFLIAHGQMAASGESLQDFLIRQMIYQSVERYKKYLIEQDYNITLASGEAIQQNHANVVSNLDTQEQDILGSYGL